MAPILLFLGTLILSLWAASRFKGTYHRYSQVPAQSGITGAEAAARILAQAGIQNVEIVAHDEMLGDHYDPSHKRLVLSRENYYGTSLAALGVAAHECGHAIQDKIGYAPLQWRMSAVAITGVASQIVTFLPWLGVFGGLFNSTAALWIMALSWGILMLFQLITLPVEFDASRRAKAILGGMGFICEGDEAVGVRKTLDAAAWTYVAAFVTSLAYMLWYLLPLLTGRSSDE